MRFSLFYHSLVSDWNHGNAHFLRGFSSELKRRGHQLRIYEPADSWSRKNLIQDHGAEPLQEFQSFYPDLSATFYRRDSVNFAAIADWSDVVIVHEWNEPWLIDTWSQTRRTNSKFRLLFHDTHHRAVSDPHSLEKLELQKYDGVLAFGEVLSAAYRQNRWNRNVWTWHEAADIHAFKPGAVDEARQADLVWVGNWGDDERARELETFLFQPVRELGLSCNIHGVRYPQQVLRNLESQGISHRGWLANYRVPEVFAAHRVTVHVPRRYYTQMLPGIPTIRPFEALACGIPLITAPWQDSEHLFSPGQDFLVAHDGEEMKKHLREILGDRDFARELAAHGRETILARHTCAHRVDELTQICRELGVDEHPRVDERPAQVKPSIERRVSSVGGEHA